MKSPGESEASQEWETLCCKYRLVGNICDLPCPAPLLSSSQITGFSCCPLLFTSRASPSDQWPYIHWPLNTQMLCDISFKEEEPCGHPRAVKDIISVNNVPAQLFTRKDLQEHILLSEGHDWVTSPRAMSAPVQRLSMLKVNPSLFSQPLSKAFPWLPLATWNF